MGMQELIDGAKLPAFRGGLRVRRSRRCESQLLPLRLDMHSPSGLTYVKLEPGFVTERGRKTAPRLRFSQHPGFIPSRTLKRPQTQRRLIDPYPFSDVIVKHY